MSKNLKHSLSLFWLAVILITGYKIFSKGQEGLATTNTPELAETEPAPQPEPEGIVQERIVTQTVTVTQTVVQIPEVPTNTPPQQHPEVLKAEAELETLKASIHENSHALKASFLEAKNLADEGYAAMNDVSKSKRQLSSLHQELAEVEAELKSYAERKELTSGFRKYGPKGLAKRKIALKAQIEEAKQLLKKRQRRTVDLDRAYKKANATKMQLHQKLNADTKKRRQLEALITTLKQEKV